MAVSVKEVAKRAEPYPEMIFQFSRVDRDGRVYLSEKIVSMGLWT
jgi:hypothetical protein